VLRSEVGAVRKEARGGDEHGGCAHSLAPPPPPHPHPRPHQVSALKLGIHSVFGKVGCSSAVNLELLGSEGVTEANLMQYLGIIEQRTHEILQLYAASQPQANPGSGPTSAPAPAPAQRGSLPTAIPPPNAYLRSGAPPLLAASQVQARDAGADAGSGAGGAGPSGMAHLLGQGPRLPAGSYSISIRPPSTGEDDGSDSDEAPSLPRPPPPAHRPPPTAPAPPPFPSRCGTARLRPSAAPLLRSTRMARPRTLWCGPHTAGLRGGGGGAPA
jgi:hypothetical protein